MGCEALKSGRRHARVLGIDGRKTSSSNPGSELELLIERKASVHPPD